MYGSVPSTAAVSVRRVTIVPRQHLGLEAGDAEVGQLRAVAAQQHVRGLEIAVHDAALVRVRQGGEQAPEHRRGLGRRQRAARDARAQVAALDQRHREPRRGVVRPVREHAHDRRVIQARSMTISRAKRATTSGLSASAGARNLSATMAPSGAIAR